MALRLDNLTKEYRSRKRTTLALRSATVTLPERGLVFINGISGSGKTTLMNMLCGLDRPTSGAIYWNDENITDSSEAKWDRHRNMVTGIVFQDFNLLEDMTVAENLMLPLKLRVYEEPVSKEQALKALGYVGLEGYGDALCGQLSAGQKQRVAIARAIIKSPKIVLADEATGNLDPQNTEEIFRLFDRISKHCLVILISHDRQAADMYADRILTLSEGKIVEDRDNTKIKKLSDGSYEIALDMDGRTESKPLDRFDLKQEILQKGTWDEEGSVFFQGNIRVDRVGKIEEKPQEPVVSGVGKACRLPARDTFRQAMLILRSSLGKMLLALILSTFLSVLFFGTVLLVNNDYSIAVEKYMDSLGDAAFEMVHVSETDGQEIAEYNGKAYLHGLAEASGGNYLKEAAEIRIYVSDPENNHEAFDTTQDEESMAGSSGAVISEEVEYRKACGVYADAEIPKGVLFREGTAPSGDEEVAVSLGIAEAYGLHLSDRLYTDEGSFTICGIFALQASSTRDMVLLTKSRVMGSLDNVSSVFLPAVDITMATAAREFAERVAQVGTAEKITETDLTWGRLPASNNEVLISDVKAMEYGDYLNHAFPVHFRIPDLYDPKYEGKYDNKINLFEMIGKKVDVVGVYSSGAQECYSEILFTSEVYGRILEAYKEYHSFLGCLYIPEGDISKQVHALTEAGYRIDDDRCAAIYSYRNATMMLKKVLYAVLSVVFLMLTFILVAFLSYSVKDHARRIGILRSIGVCSGDIRRIFMWNTLLLSAVSVLLADVFTLGLFRYLNRMRNDLMDSSVLRMDIFFPDGRLLALASLAVLVISVMVTFVPLIVASKKKTIELLK